MKHRRIMLALIVLLCIVALLSGTLLALHADHECHQTACHVCMLLAQSAKTCLYAAVACLSIGLLENLIQRCLCGFNESRYIPDWTLVRRKVKLLD